MKRQAADSIFIKHILDKRLVSKVYKEFLNVKSKKTNNSI